MVVQILQQSMIIGEFPDSLKIAHITQFLKLVTQVHHLNIDQSLFSQYCQSYLKKFFITESIPI